VPAKVSDQFQPFNRRIDHGPDLPGVFLPHSRQIDEVRFTAVHADDELSGSL
jgi:hypothetical protein